jgi:putative peptidoglycan lipid II flippase
MAAVLGAGPVADAFLVAFRLPNHFRAIFAEGAFSAAFVPAYARVRHQNGSEAARFFGDRIFTILLVSQLCLLGLAFLFTPEVIRLLAPGFENDPERFALAVSLTRITFPYLLMMTMVTLFSGILVALDKFASASGAPILLNVTMIAALALAFFFPTAGHAAAWGVLIAGCLEVLLLAADAGRSGVITRLRWPRWDADVKQFFVALGPAVVGSAGIQLALFADTIIASFLPAGALSALYYADRLNQLPIGVIGIAVGTVILPEMTRRLASGDDVGAQQVQSRAIEFALLLAVPCLVAFMLVPEFIMRALFVRGAFTSSDAASAAITLAAYAIGLIPFVLIRSVVATFFARGDTATPVKAALIAVAVNIGFKILLTGPLAQVGLAFATSIGAWINFALVLWFGTRAGLMKFEFGFLRTIMKLAGAGAILAAALWMLRRPVIGFFGAETGLHAIGALIALAVIGVVVYGLAVVAFFGKAGIARLRGA